MISESDNAWPLRSDPADSFGFLGAAIGLAAAVHPNCVETLPLSKVTGLAGGIVLLSKSGPTDICPHPLLAVRSHDRPPIPAKQGAEAPLPRQVQQRKCCGRYVQVSSYAMRNRTRVPEPKPAKWKMVPPLLRRN